MKGLTNASKVGVIRGCGHALCMQCIDKFVKPQKKCYVCEQTAKHEKDIIALVSGGTINVYLFIH